MSQKGLLIIPGAQKSGTTTLWEMLLQHDHIHALSDSSGLCKEPQFFSLKRNIANAKLEWYKSLIGENSGWYLDASTSYLFTPKSLSLVHALHIPVRFLVVLRDPTERALSGYLQMRKKENSKFERRTYREIIDFVWDNRTEGIAEAENEGIRRAISNKQIDPDYLLKHLRKLPVTVDKENLQDPFWCYKYLQYSMYSARVDRLATISQKTLILSMTEMLADTSNTTDRIFEFLDLTRQDVELPHVFKTKYSYTPGWWKTVATLSKTIGIHPKPESRLHELINLLRPESISTTKQAMARNKKPLQRTRKLLDDEYKYWGLHNPSVLSS